VINIASDKGREGIKVINGKYELFKLVIIIIFSNNLDLVSNASLFTGSPI
jgi:hypothetical protein